MGVGAFLFAVRRCDCEMLHGETAPPHKYSLAKVSPILGPSVLSKLRTDEVCEWETWKAQRSASDVTPTTFETFVQKTVEQEMRDEIRQKPAVLRSWKGWNTQKCYMKHRSTYKH